MYGVVVGGTLNRRERASKSSMPLGSYADGEYIYIENYNDEWYKTAFNYNDSITTGYVMKAYVATTGDTVTVRKNSVNVRNAADGSAVLYMVNSGASSRIASIQKVGDFGWMEGNFGGGTGWIRGDMFNKAGDNTIPNLLVSFPGNTKGEYVNLRALPTTDSDIVFTFLTDCDTIFNTFSGVGTTDEQRSWLYCEYNGHKGYVYSPYVAGKTSMNTVPMRQINGNSVRLRVLPVNGTVITMLNNNCRVLVLDDYSVSGWIRVATGSDGSGWVSADYIK